MNDDGGQPAAVEIQDTDPFILAFFEQSDFGNAERARALAAGKLKWIEDLQGWAWYDGTRFDLERGGIQAQRLAHRVVHHIKVESDALFALARDCRKGDRSSNEILIRLRGRDAVPEDLESLGNRLLRHRTKSGSASMAAGMLRQLRALEGIAALSEDFDADPLIYNTANRTLRFVQVEGRWTVRDAPHDPADMLMQVAEVDYAPDAPCDFWCERLAMLTPDPEQLKALQLLYGYTVTGLTSDQAFYVNQGVGNDGKSTTHQALGELHGDYYRHAGVKTFLQGADRGGAEHRSDLVRLKGDIRFVTCDEPKGRSVWDGETIKQVTGSLITARGSNERTEITYRPRFKLFIECNNIPRAPSDDKGFRRRFKLYQWKVSLPMAGEDGYIPIDQALDRLRSERSGILNWLIAGAIEWLETRTIPQPAAMAAVLSDFWADSSPLLEWMGEWCDCSNPEERSYAKDLHEHFKQFCENLGIEHILNSTQFGRALRDKQFTKLKDSKGLTMRKGIRLLTQEEHDARAVREASPVDPARAAALPDAEHSRGAGLSDAFDEDVP